MTSAVIRLEEPCDFVSIHHLTRRAFAPMPYAVGNEQDLIATLRQTGALALSIVAEAEGQIAGHVAFSPSYADDGEDGWYALGPISVEPILQRQGIGTMLVRDGPSRLRGIDAAGCILVGDPAYYARHGFRPFPDLAPESEPAEYFMILPLRISVPTVGMRFHPAFYET